MRKCTKEFTRFDGMLPVEQREFTFTGCKQRDSHKPARQFSSSSRQCHVRSTFASILRQKESRRPFSRTECENAKPRTRCRSALTASIPNDKRRISERKTNEKRRYCVEHPSSISRIRFLQTETPPSALNPCTLYNIKLYLYRMLRRFSSHSAIQSSES